MRVVGDLAERQGGQPAALGDELHGLEQRLLAEEAAVTRVGAVARIGELGGRHDLEREPLLAGEGLRPREVGARQRGRVGDDAQGARSEAPVRGVQEDGRIDAAGEGHGHAR
jgi:hypothetical protein